MSAATIRSGLATNLAAITNVQISQYVLPDPTPPAFEIELDPEGVNYDQASRRGRDEWFWTVRGFAAMNTAEGAQKILDGWLAPFGSTSVKAALESDRSASGALGGAAHDLHVMSARPRSFQSVSSGSTYLGAEWRVRVIASGSA